MPEMMRWEITIKAGGAKLPPVVVNVPSFAALRDALSAEGLGLNINALTFVSLRRLS